jgi:hypothetical protein
MKDLGPMQYFLRLQVQHYLNGTLLHQHKYTHECFSLAGLQDNNLVFTPIEVNLKFFNADSDSSSGPLMYR